MRRAGPVNRLVQAKDELERRMVLKALKAAGWNGAAAARSLGTSRSYLHQVRKRHGIERPAPSRHANRGNAAWCEMADH